MASVTLGRIEEFDLVGKSGLGKSGLSMRRGWSISLQLILLRKMKKMFSFSDRDRCCYVQGAERPGCACQARNQDRLKLSSVFVFILVSGSLVKLLRSLPDCAHCLNTILLRFFGGYDS